MKKFFIALFLVVASALTAQSSSTWSEAPPDLKLFEDLDIEYYARMYTMGDPYFGETWLRENNRDFFNNWGYRAYQAGDLLQAAIFWSAAVQFDETHALAHYNLACVLAIFMTGFENRDYFQYRTITSPEYSDIYANYLDKVLNHLKTAVSLDPSRLQRIPNDPDLKILPDTEAVRIVLAGPNPTAETILTQFPYWYSIQGGAATPGDNITFQTNGRVSFEYDINMRRRLYDPNTPDLSFSGSWRIVNGSVVIETDDGRTISGTFQLGLDELGFLKTRQLHLEGLGPFGDYDTHYWTMQDA